MSKHAGRLLREMMQSGECLCLPGAFNGFVGRLCAEAGHKGCYISGGAISACHGVPDIGLLSVDYFSKIIREVATASGLPIIADADTGFGEFEMVTRTVHEYNNAGAGGFHIEDQEFPKKCGHLEGKQLIATEAFCEKIKRAVQASKKVSNGDFIVCARTDANAVEGLESAIYRAKHYANAGADMIFPEGLKSESEFHQFAKALKSAKGEAPGGGPYLLANMTEFGKTPEISVTKFQELGYHAVIFPVSTFRVAMKAVQDFLEHLKATGNVGAAEKKLMYTRQELYATLQYNTAEEWVYPSSSKQ